MFKVPGTVIASSGSHQAQESSHMSPYDIINPFLALPAVPEAKPAVAQQ
jgi:hypothetical protein